MEEEEEVRRGDRQGGGEEGEEGRGFLRHRTQRMLRSGGAPKDVLCSTRLVAGRPGFHRPRDHVHQGVMEEATQQPEILFINENE